MQTMNRSVRFVLLLTAALSLASCSLGGSPDETVEQFYNYLNTGEYSKAKEQRLK